MVKTRMGLLDLRIQTAKVNATLRGARVINIYDAGRTYVLKLSVPPVRGHQDEGSSSSSMSGLSTHLSWEKRLLLIESGVRLHMTQYDREKDVPSGFCLKLRKHIRMRRLEAVHQLGGGGDRIIDLVFSGEGSICAHLIVEAFAGGNVILTDADYTILTLLRTYRLTGSETDSTRVAVRERYPVENARSRSRADLDAFIAAAKRAQSTVPDDAALSKVTGRAARRKLYARGVARKALAVELSLEPTLLEHALITAGLSADATLNEVCENNFEGLRSVYDAINEIDYLLTQEMARGEMKGYIITTPLDGQNGPKERFDEFVPYLFAQYRDRSYIEFETFDEAADEFFAHLESERVAVAQAKREAATFKKVDKLESELHGQVTAFENARDKNTEMAQAIESNIAEVDAAITVIRSAVAADEPWDGLERMVQDEKRNGNPIAEIIHSLQLEKNHITLMLEDTFGYNDEEDENDTLGDENDDSDGGDSDGESAGESDFSNDGGDRENRATEKRTDKKKIFEPSPESRKALLVPVDITLAAHANARRYYEMRKSAAAKMEKAAEVKDRTIKVASKKAVNEAHRLEEQAVAASIRARRKAFWFEKFHWFVSSENFLVVAGRDAQQNDLLVKRYLGPADVYVHADVEGASSVLVKNQKRLESGRYTDIPQMTLDQAGTFAMCRSAAWESKIVTSAWWVRASQISKTTSTGQYLPVGNFAIRGKKNFLNPTQLIMGLGFLFKVDEASAANHRGERSVRGIQDECIPNMDSPDLVRNKNQEMVQERPENIQRAQLEHSYDKKLLKDGQSRVGINSVDDIEISLSNEHLDSFPQKTSEHLAIQGAVDNIKPQDESFLDGNQSRGVQHTVENCPAPRENVLNDAQSTDLVDTIRDNASSVTENDKQSKKPSSLKEKKGPKSKGGNMLPRGKKHKLKKMKKYSDQDEEERQIALAVLGSKLIKEEAEKLGLDDSLGGAVDEERDSEEKHDSGKPSQPKGQVREPRHEELLLMDDEGVIELEKLEVDTTAAMNLLTAVPLENDNVEFALPICAPLSALSQYRYRIKMMPGSMKRGKAYRAAVVLFQKQAERELSQYKKERDAIRIAPESDGIQCMLGNVKIMAPGLADAQKTISKAKKGAASTKKSKQK